MKHLFIIALSLVPLTSYAQTNTDSLWTASWANVDYAIPESPAFHILGTSPDNLLKPSSARSITLNIGNYFLTNGPVIPKTLAVEIAPWLLANDNASLKRYANNLFLHRIRFSLGTATEDGGAYRVAEGLRFTIVDHTDLKVDKPLVDFIKTSLKSRAELMEWVEDNYMNELNAIVLAAQIPNEEGEMCTTFDELNNLPESANGTHSENERISAVYKNITLFKEEKIKLKNDQGIASSKDNIEAFRKQRKEEKWNQTIVEMGLAALQSSPDSLVPHLKTSQYGLWFNSSFPLFKTKGQLLLGANGSIVDSISWTGRFSGGARLYYGSNSFRAFVQAQYDYANQLNTGTLTAGCQFSVIEKIWAQVTLNFVYQDDKTSFQPGFNLGFGSLGNDKTPKKGAR